MQYLAGVFLFRKGGFLARLLAAFCACILMCLPQQAAHAADPRVLLLLTPESNPTGVSIMNNPKAEFSATGMDTTTIEALDMSNAINATTFDPPAGAYDMVVISSVYSTIHATNWTVINNAIVSRAANSFVMFVDSCGSCGNDKFNMLSAVNASGGFTATLSGGDNAYYNFQLNTDSPYSSSFTGTLNALRGGWIQYMQSVPKDNILFMSGNNVPPPPESTGSASGVFIPATQSYSGAGACVFAIVDASPFDTNHCNAAPTCYGANAGKVAPAFLDASGPAGACGLPASISMAFSSASTTPGGTVALTISIASSSALAINGLRVENTLPAPLLLAGAPTTTCTGGTLSTSGGNAISLTGATLPAGGCTITVPVRWDSSAAGIAACTGAAVTNTIQPGLLNDFSTNSGQVNTPATADISCTPGAPPPTTATPVPVSSRLGLGLMALLLGCAAAGMQWRRNLRASRWT